MTDFWTDSVRGLTPYVPGEQRTGPDIVKLNTNENPYPPSPQVIDALRAVSGDALRRYPDPESTALRQTLADYHGLNIDQVFVGNGSDEILALAFLTFFANGKALQFPDISYSFYPVYCNLYSIEAHTVSLEQDYSLELERFMPNAGGIVFPNPNAPTACDVSMDAVANLLDKHTDQVLLVDEAYADFGAQSVVSLVNKYPNLLVSHTFSKGRSMAGLRLGVAFGDSDLIEGLQRVKNSFNSYPVDVMAQAAGIASIKDNTYYRETVDKIIETRQQTISALKDKGFDVLPSAANFVFARPVGGNAAGVYEKLNQAGVLVRYWSKPRLDEWLRISIGTPDEMARLLSCLDA
ncbi:MAG: histidinol-phosphate transaminase [Granulosicoccus sp.]